MAAAARLEVSGKGLRLLLRALQAEARRLEMEIAATRERIKTFEERHGISSVPVSSWISISAEN